MRRRGLPRRGCVVACRDVVTAWLLATEACRALYEPEYPLDPILPAPLGGPAKGELHGVRRTDLHKVYSAEIAALQL